MTRNIYILIISLLATIAYAGNNPGIDFYKAGEPDIAKKLFLKQLNSSPAEKAVALYYLGEIAFDAGQPAEALNYYKQGGKPIPNTHSIKLAKENPAENRPDGRRKSI